MQKSLLSVLIIVIITKLIYNIYKEWKNLYVSTRCTFMLEMFLMCVTARPKLWWNYLWHTLLLLLISVNTVSTKNRSFFNHFRFFIHTHHHSRNLSKRTPLVWYRLTLAWRQCFIIFQLTLFWNVRLRTKERSWSNLVVLQICWK